MKNGLVCQLNFTTFLPQNMWCVAEEGHKIAGFTQLMAMTHIESLKQLAKGARIGKGRLSNQEIENQPKFLMVGGRQDCELCLRSYGVTQRI